MEPSVVLLAEDGSVWVNGSNSKGQLGLGMLSTFTSVPEQLDGIVATKMATGADHTMILTGERDVIVFGDNSFCQLGPLIE